MPLNRRKFLQKSTLAAAASLSSGGLLSRLTAADAPSADAAAAAAAAGAVPTTPVTTAPVVYPPAPTPILPPAGFGVAPGPFQPTWESLANYQVPDWYRDAKFGIWAHWGPQCQPEQGDWYAQKMYNPRDPVYTWHVAHYGHPSKFGFKDVINEWHAEKWDPVNLLSLYKRAGAKFFSAMANHHDNMDMFDSTYQPWNSTKIGPKKDIVGGWEKATRAAGLRFAVSCHGDRSWDWMQNAQGADPTGPMAGVRYDGLLSKADGKGTWWEGLDPQDLYAQYHPRGRYQWNLSPIADAMPVDKAFSDKFFYRTIDLINKYNPDLLYFDDTVLPIYPSTDIGLRIAAYFYNTNMARHGGKLEAVMTGKGLKGDERKALVLDVERGVQSGGDPLPWQTDTCIGGWHYQRSLLDQHKYKTAQDVARMLVDIISKNGCLQLSIPLPGNGLPDADEMKFLAEFTQWMDRNNEGIYSTRPWKVYGEGPSTVASAPGRFGGSVDVRPYTAQDFRFVQKGGALYAFAMGWPDTGRLVITSLAEGAVNAPGQIERVEMLGVGEPIKFTRDASGLTIPLPEKKVGDYAYCFKINGPGLTV